tara:strand:+ start:129 stop:476 length:348 start_codon:yes stop_codon:yes gene_type:complete
MRLDKRTEEEIVNTPFMPYPGYPYLPKPYSTPDDAPVVPVEPEPVAPDYPDHPLAPYLDPFNLRRFINPKYNPFMPGFFDPVIDPLFGRNAIEGESQPTRMNKRMAMRLNKRMGY